MRTKQELLDEIEFLMGQEGQGRLELTFAEILLDIRELLIEVKKACLKKNRQ